MKVLYPEIIPYHTFFLETASQHKVYVEQSGNANGIPVLFLHGGPCSGTKPDHRRFFNPDAYRIILFDQRGCGQSLPFGELQHNTTQDLLNDMEQIRQQLGIAQWLLFGGSWGATLALLYAQKFPEQVCAMIIRGVFLARQKDLDWFVKCGAERIYPEVWQRLTTCISIWDPDQLIANLYAALEQGNGQVQERVCSAWQAWGAQVALAQAYNPDVETEPFTEKMLKQVRMELHYALHRYFMAENQILKQCDAIQSIPTRIIHGRNDLVCPMEAAMSLHQALPNAEYLVLPNAGHIAQGDEMIDALVSASDKMATLLGGDTRA